jgi:hypothetical protein
MDWTVSPSSGRKPTKLLAEHACKTATKYVSKKHVLHDWTDHHLQEIQGIGLFSQLTKSLDTSSIWTPIIGNEVSKLELHPV